MIKFHLVNFKSKYKDHDLVLVGTLEQVKKSAESFASYYGTDYYIESTSETLTRSMQGIETILVCNE